ncbi:MAG: hypothetical protein A3A08_01745 [Candidatus Nealsonbacteria bacterium RIFCSPLOWO2_01_FULL_41_9]|uniref:Uncharacterized protein n=1 Tax=Candidatus Nealsonbacteria bacterium RIFCSPLOWO2_01_FULL_41_9 TaxID=1801671 RepID=A0A1G2EE23_9BACT|nr:MAG: hypothetical protein A3A08_01745 [Candidatus Nealsonbacteria bacterium RIFCSPLOWO2_01_FULL_41_9]
MPRWKTRSCPRCGGDLFIDRSLDGWYEQCLQCSYTQELKPIVQQETVKIKKEAENREEAVY